MQTCMRSIIRVWAAILCAAIAFSVVSVEQAHAATQVYTSTSGTNRVYTVNSTANPQAELNGVPDANVYIDKLPGSAGVTYENGYVGSTCVLKYGTKSSATGFYITDAAYGTSQTLTTQARMKFANAGYTAQGAPLDVAMAVTGWKAASGYPIPANSIVVRNNGGFGGKAKARFAIQVTWHVYAHTGTSADFTSATELKGKKMFFRFTDLDITITNSTILNTTPWTEGIMYRGTIFTSDATGESRGGGWYRDVYIGKKDDRTNYDTKRADKKHPMLNADFTATVASMSNTGGRFYTSHVCDSSNCSSCSRIGYSPCSYSWFSGYGCGTGGGATTTMTYYPDTNVSIEKSFTSTSEAESNTTATLGPSSPVDSRFTGITGLSGVPVQSSDGKVNWLNFTATCTLDAVRTNTPKQLYITDALPRCLDASKAQLVSVKKQGLRWSGSGSSWTQVYGAETDVTSKWTCGLVSGSTQTIQIKSTSNSHGNNDAGKFKINFKVPVRAGYNFAGTEDAFAGYFLKYSNQMTLTVSRDPNNTPDDEDDEQGMAEFELDGADEFYKVKGDEDFALSPSWMGAQGAVTIAYRSSNESVATVSAAGVVHIEDVGTCEITVTGTDSVVGGGVIATDSYVVHLTVDEASDVSGVVLPTYDWNQLTGVIANYAGTALDDLAERFAPVAAFADYADDVVRSSNEVTFTLKGYAAPYPLAVKLDRDLGDTAQGDAKRSGAKYTLKYWNNWTRSGNPLKSVTVTTNEDGELTYSALAIALDGGSVMPWGSYSLEEQASGVSTGYTPDLNTYLMWVRSDSSTGNVYLESSGFTSQGSVTRGMLQGAIQKANLRIEMIDSVLISQAQGDATRAGTIFEVLNASENAIKYGGVVYQPGDVVATLDGSNVTGTDGFTSISNLPYGTYTVREKADTAPVGYRTSDRQRTQVMHSNGGTYSLSAGSGIDNAVKRGSVRGVKLDADSPTGSAQGSGSMAGAVIGVKLMSSQPITRGGATYNFGNTVGTATTDADGAWSMDDLPYGSYVAFEQSPPSGYLINSTWSVPFTIRDDYAIVDITDKPLYDGGVRGGVKLGKVDLSTLETVGQGDGVLAGAKFDIISQNAGDVLVDGKWCSTGDTVKTITTGITGIATTGARDLPYGTYRIKESAGTTGYWTSSQVVDFLITQDGVIVDVSSSAFKEPAVRTKLIVRKVDLDAPSKQLSGCKFSLWNASAQSVVYNGRTYARGAKICEVTTGSDGSATTPYDLPYGTYAWHEEVAPTGYNLDYDYHFVEIRTNELGDAITKATGSKSSLFGV